MDEAHEYTEKRLKVLEVQITREYRQAEKEIQNKLDDYMDRYRKKDETWQKWVDEGKRTKKEYEEWRIGQLAIGKRWKEQKETIVNDLSQVNQIARNIVSKEMPDIYAENHNYGTYEVENGSLIDTSYVLYDKDTVENLFTEQKLYHDPGRSTLSKIAQGKETRWNKQLVQSAMLQGILQGESIPDIASRIANSVGDKNRNAAIRNARTITTGVENKGRIDSYNRANKMGIKTQKQWIATLDGRTRHSHRILDGEKAIVSKKFSNGCEYPGDPNGTAGEIYNCRCTMIADIEGYENDLKNRKDDKLGGMTYEEWKKAKPTSQDIRHQEKVSKKEKGVYIGKYRGVPIELSSPTAYTITTRNPAVGKPSAVIGGAPLSKRQERLLSLLKKDGDIVELRKKDVNMRDLASLSANEGVEFALLSKGQTRMVIRGSELKVSTISEETARAYAAEGWKLSGHTHVVGGLIPSPGDIGVLEAFNQNQSMIYDITGNWGMVYAE